jgi:predicted lipoprotein with Yx(FWY)xxD motif
LVALERGLSGRITGIAIALLLVGLVIGYGAGYYTAPRQAGTTTVTTPTTISTTVTTTVTTTTTVGLPPAPATVSYTVKLAYSEDKGFYLTDANGRALYFFAKDYDGKSHCYGKCAEHWPPFYAENLVLPPGLEKEDFGVITRSDGSKQLTYKGWPLYYYAGDKKPGDVNGDGVKNVWFLAKPDYTVLVSVKDGVGMYLVDDKGRTLYFFAKDRQGNSTCYGACAQKWPPFTPKSLIIPVTLNPADFKFIKRSDGSIQLTYKGHPLYYWVNDKARGDTTGQGVKGVWYVAYVNGTIPGKP